MEKRIKKKKKEVEIKGKKKIKNKKYVEEIKFSPLFL